MSLRISEKKMTDKFRNFRKQRINKKITFMGVQKTQDTDRIV